MQLHRHFPSTTKMRIILYGGAFLIGIDMFLYVLALNNFYFISPKFSIYKTIFVLHFIYVYGFLINISKTKFSKVFWVAIGPFILAPIFLVSGYLFFYDNKTEYYIMTSPDKTQTLTIGYYQWSLGETNHYYDFYQKTNVIGLKKKVNSETLHIMTRNTNASDLDVLGIQNAKWSKQNNIHFGSPYHDTTVQLE